MRGAADSHLDVLFGWKLLRCEIPKQFSALPGAGKRIAKNEVGGKAGAADDTGGGGGYADDYDALMRLLEQLHRRRSRVPELIFESKRSSRQPFPNWVSFPDKNRR
jgi:hypothetical protein